MMGGLFVGITVLDHVAVVVGAAQKGYAGRKIVARETRGDDDRRDEDEEGVDVRRAFLIDERWVDSVLNECGLVLHSFVHNGVKLVVGHHLEETGRQFFSCQEVFIMCSRRRYSCPSLP